VVCGGAQVIAVTDENCYIIGGAKVACNTRNAIEHRLKIENRPTDHLEHVGGRGLLLKSLVTLGCAFGKLTFEIGYTLLGIGF
jgi:hypothetical protein